MALLIGIARGIQVILEAGYIVDTIVFAVSQPLIKVGPELAVVGMLIFQSIINFFITSVSGQAYVTIPLMAPLSDLVGVSRQVAVLAFQFGDGFKNILQTSLQYGNPVIHPSVTLLNAALIERIQGDFYFYEEGVTPAVGRLLKAVDQERITIGRCLGFEIISEPKLGQMQGYMKEMTLQNLKEIIEDK
jgi:hypothetical protein